MFTRRLRAMELLAGCSHELHSGTCSSHGQPRLASTSCVNDSKECLSGAVRLSAPSGVEPQNTGIYFGSAGDRRACFESCPKCCRFGERHASSPMVEGAGGLWSWPLWVSSALHSGWCSVDCAAKQATSVDVGRGFSWVNSTARNRRPLVEAQGLSSHVQGDAAFFSVILTSMG